MKRSRLTRIVVFSAYVLLAVPTILIWTLGSLFANVQEYIDVCQDNWEERD